MSIRIKAEKNEKDELAQRKQQPMKHKIDPSVDCVFKAILGNEKYKNLLIHFLNAVLEPAEKIEEISILNPYNEREFENCFMQI